MVHIVHKTPIIAITRLMFDQKNRKMSHGGLGVKGLKSVTDYLNGPNIHFFMFLISYVDYLDKKIRVSR